MPLYEYRCQECEALSEILQRMDDPPAETCPECGGRLKKLVSAPAFQFKGSGWYVTDYARGGAKAEGAGSGEGESAGGSESKGDTGAKAEGSSGGSSKDTGKDTGKSASKPDAKPASATPA